EFHRLQALHLVDRHLLEVRVRFAQHSARFGQIVMNLLPLAILGHHFEMLAVRLRDFAVLLRVVDHGRIGHLPIQLLKTHFDLFELFQELHGGLGDDQFAALLFFQIHGALQRADGHGGLLVRWRLRSDALQPQSGRGEHRQEGAAALRGKPDKFIAQAGDHGQQDHAAEQFHGEAVERDESIDAHGNDHYHQQEAGPAARVEGDERLRVLDRDRLARFEIEYYFVLRAVILEDAPDILHARDGVEKNQEDEHADGAIGKVEGDPALQRRIDGFQLGDEIERDELVEE